MANQQLLAPCGLDCTRCDIFIAASDPEAAIQLAEQWKSWNPDAKPEWFCCQGCRGDKNVRWTDNCSIADCCESKELQDCGQCDEFPCQTYQDWTGSCPQHKAAFEKLQSMR